MKDQGMEKPLQFLNFPKMLPKCFSHPQSTQNHKQQNPKRGLLGFVICGFGRVFGAKSPFWQHFRKVRKF